MKAIHGRAERAQHPVATVREQLPMAGMRFALTQPSAGKVMLRSIDYEGTNSEIWPFPHISIPYDGSLGRAPHSERRGSLLRRLKTRVTHDG